MPNELGLRIHQLREQKNLTQEELADALDVNQKQVSFWESGRARPQKESLRKLAGFFGLKVEDIVRSQRRPTETAPADPLESEYPIPLLGPIAASPGRIRDAIHPVRYIYGTKNDTGCYACWVAGDSMEPKYAHGEIVIWRPVNLELTPDAEEGAIYVPYEAVKNFNGKDCIILHDGASSLKRLRIEKTKGLKYSVDIISLNDFYPPIHVRMGAEFRIQGEVKRSEKPR